MTDLILTSDVEAAIAARDAALDKLEQARLLIEQANGLFVRAHHSFRIPAHKKYRAPGFTLSDNHFKGYPASLKIDEVRRELDKVLWRNTLDSSGLTNLMSKETYQEAMNSLEKDPPEFNKANINASYSDFASRLSEIEDVAIIDLFRGLSWDYRSHEPVKIGKRIVLTGMVYTGIASGSGTSNRNEHYLTDLEKAIYRSRNLSPPVADESVLVKLNKAIRDRDDLYEDEIFKIRWYGNGNLHVYLLEQYDIDSLNRRVAKAMPNALPRHK